MAPSRDEIAKTWSIVAVGPAAPIALRALWPKGVANPRPTQNITFTAAAYPEPGGRKRAFEEKAIALNTQGYNIYIVFNSISPSFRGDEHNQQAVCDKHIVSRDYVLIDIDRVATAQPASDDELSEVQDVAARVEKYLTDGWGFEPFAVLSGNGSHLYLPLASVTTTVESKELCRRFLTLLSGIFDTPTVKIDTAVYNAARITKLPGTIARKGTATNKRPYRMARVLK